MRLDGLGLLGASDFRMQRNFTRDALKCCYLSCWFDLGDPSNAGYHLAAGCDRRKNDLAVAAQVHGNVIRSFMP